MGTVKIVIGKAVEGDYGDIINLQTKYYLTNLTEEQRKDGFLSAEFSMSQIAAMANDLGIFVARDKERIIGYVGTSRIDLVPRPPILDAMADSIKGAYMAAHKLSEMNLFVYGPVCIDELYRGLGILRRLYEAVIIHTKSLFDGGVAFISTENRRSFGAHVKGLGMEDMGQFTFGSSSYHLVGFVSS
jgi:hypothetical protein